MTRFAGHLSGLAYSIVQGSGIGPTTYDISASDLHPQDHENRIVIFADDTYMYLLVGSTKRHTISTQLDHITEWAKQTNAAKTSEMIISKRGKEPPPPLYGIKRVKSMVILGITITDDLRASNHDDSVIASCSQSMYALRVLKAHGLPAAALHTVTRATTIARLLYASPAWWGLTTDKDRDRLDKLYTRIKRMDCLPDNAPTLPSLVGQADERLFRSIELNSSHVLRDLLPPKAKRPYKLRPRAHDYVLPLKTLSRASYTSSR